MQIELSANAEAMLNSLMVEGGDPAAIVEAAIAEFVEIHGAGEAPLCIDPVTGEPLTHEQLKAELQKGIDDIEAGRVAPLDIEDIKRRGRERLAAQRERSTDAAS